MLREIGSRSIDDLFAAIPAVIAYNQLGQTIREFGARMDDFCLEFLNAVERGPERPER